MQIINYSPAYQPYFEKFNKAWLEKYFVLEPVDEWVLTHPDEAILKNGGCILFAVDNNQVIGTVALQWVQPRIYELTKMAVDERFHGIGAGKLLCGAGIQKAKELCAKKIILYTNSKLIPAIHIYQLYGFVDVPMRAEKYKRADRMMELEL